MMQYWKGKGRYQKEYLDLCLRLVPLTGRANTEGGELLRLASNVNYDIYNNGGDNLGRGGGMESQVGELLDKLEEIGKPKTARELRVCLRMLLTGKTSVEDERLASIVDHVIDIAVLYARKQEAA